VGLTLVLSGALSAADSAVYSLGPSRVRTLVEEGFRGADGLNEARRTAASVRTAASIVSAVLNFASVGILVGAAVFRWGSLAIAPVVPASALLVLLVSRGIPRLIAARQSVKLALVSAPFLLRLEHAVRPVLAPFWRLEEMVARGRGPEDLTADDREIRELAELGRREGVVEEEEHELVERAFRMDELSAWDIMTPRVDVFAWKDSLTLEEIVPELQSVPYSRVPVYGENIDDVTGILYVREAYDAYVKGHSTLPLSQLSREPYFVPHSLPLPQLLRSFQARRIHMGIVADEFGGTDGLVTLEDVIEELVGEIQDETDIAEESIHRISRDELEVEGGVEVREVNYAFNVSLPHLDHRSLNGYILEELGRVPVEGERLELPGLDIEVLRATDTQVLRARLTKTNSTLDRGR
jgi:putative hemolysin